MVTVDINEIDKTLIELENTIEEYNENIMNLFNNINILSTSWIGDRANLFFEKIEQEKEETRSIYKQIKQQKNIYRYIYDSYKQLGNKIKCNLDAKDIIIGKINNCIDKTNEILTVYNNINTNVYFEERDRILKNKERTTKILNRYNAIKNNVDYYFEEIKKIEQEVNNKLANIDTIKIEKFSLEDNE